MTSIQRFIATSNMAARTFVFVVVAMVAMQGGITQFAAAHTHGSHDHAGVYDHGIDQVGAGHETARHAVDHDHAGKTSKHDAADVVGCCGWMCTAGICAIGHFALNSVSENDRRDIFVAQIPPDWPSYGPDRPPRPRFLTI